LSNTTIPFLDVGYTYRVLQKEIDDAISRVLSGGQYIGGQEVTTFESNFAQFVGADHCIGVGNGLDALTLSLRSLGVGPGDEVIVPSHTFIATWLAVSENGAIPVPIDTATDEFAFDINQIESAITDRTRGIIVVHLYGCPVDLDQVAAIARRHHLWVIEDAAQAHGARYNGKRIGSLSTLTTWSFYPGKNLGAFGDGGAVTTNDTKLADSVRLLSNYGSVQKYEHKVLGVNSRLDPIQAAVLDVKLRHLDSWNGVRRAIAGLYLEELKNLEDLRLPSFTEGSCWHLFVVRTTKRDLIQSKLSEFGIGTGVHYPKPPHLQSAYRSTFERFGSALVETEKLAKEVLSLPMGPHLTQSDIEHVCGSIVPLLIRPTDNP